MSIGEASHINANNLSLKNCVIAIASKDSSWLRMKDVQISDSIWGLASYKKKPEFGPAGIVAKQLKMTNVKNPFIVEENSEMRIWDKKQKSNPNDVKVFLDLYVEQ